MTEQVKDIRLVARAIIVDNKGRVLLGLRARGHGANQWALVGGKPDDGESMEEACKREVFEELGLNFNPRFWMDRVDVISDSLKPWRVYYYVGEKIGRVRRKKDEIKAIVYASGRNFKNLNIAFDHHQILEEFFAGISRQDG